jgi:hypothetical protein
MKNKNGAVNPHELRSQGWLQTAPYERTIFFVFRLSELAGQNKALTRRLPVVESTLC